MFAKIRVWNQVLCVFVIFIFLIAQSGTLFSYQGQPAQKTDKVVKTPTGISGVLNDPNGKPIENGLLLVTNEDLDILYGEALSGGKPVGSYHITELPTAQELYVYVFHEDYPGAIDLQKIYLKEGQLKKIAISLNKKLIDSEQASSLTYLDRASFCQKLTDLLKQSENKETANKIILHLDLIKKMTQQTPTEPQLTKTPVKETQSNVEEKETTEPKSKKKRFPVLLVALGGAALVAAIVFLGKKKNSTNYDITGKWTTDLGYPGQILLSFTFSGTQEKGIATLFVNNYYLNRTAEGTGTYSVSNRDVNISIDITRSNIEDTFEATIILNGSFSDSTTIKGSIQQTGPKNDQIWGPEPITLNKM